MNSVIIASALRNVPHIAVLDELAKERFEAIDFSKILMDMYDTVDARLLDHLAAEWDLLGYNGWALADTEQKKRDLLKSAADIKRTMGTPYSIRRAAAALGIKGFVRIDEGINFFYDGEYNYDGTMYHGAGKWATFAVYFDAVQNTGITSDVLIEFRNMIDTFKPARSRLITVSTYTP